MTVWYAGSCIPGSHPYRISNTKCCIKTVVSPDDGHIVSRNTYRKEINILKKIMHQVDLIYKKKKIEFPEGFQNLINIIFD